MGYKVFLEKAYVSCVNLLPSIVAQSAYSILLHGVTWRLGFSEKPLLNFKLESRFVSAAFWNFQCAPVMCSIF